jgi:Mce-associated membrane protein
MNRLTIGLAVATVLVGAGGGIAWYADREADQRAAAGRDCLARSTAAAQAIFSYDYRTFDASVAAGKAFTTGEFTGEYATTTANLKPAAEQQQAIVRAEVSAASIVEVHGDRVELLLYVNQYRRNAAITGEKVDQNRVVLTMVPGSGGCKVAKASAI